MPEKVCFLFESTLMQPRKYQNGDLALTHTDGNPFISKVCYKKSYKIDSKILLTGKVVRDRHRDRKEMPGIGSSAMPGCI